LAGVVEVVGGEEVAVGWEVGGEGVEVVGHAVDPEDGGLAAEVVLVLADDPAEVVQAEGEGVEGRVEGGEVGEGVAGEGEGEAGEGDALVQLRERGAGPAGDCVGGVDFRAAETGTVVKGSGIGGEDAVDVGEEAGAVLAVIVDVRACDVVGLVDGCGDEIAVEVESGVGGVGENPKCVAVFASNCTSGVDDLGMETRRVAPWEIGGCTGGCDEKARGVGIAVGEVVRLICTAAAAELDNCGIVGEVVGGHPESGCRWK